MSASSRQGVWVRVGARLAAEIVRESLEDPAPDSGSCMCTALVEHKTATACSTCDRQQQEPLTRDAQARSGNRGKSCKRDTSGAEECRSRRNKKYRGICAQIPHIPLYFLLPQALYFLQPLHFLRRIALYFEFDRLIMKCLLCESCD